MQHKRVVTGTAIDRDFGAVILDSIVAGAGTDGVVAAAAIDGIGSRAAGNGIGAGRTGDRDARRGAQRTRIDILEIRDVDGIAGGLIGRAEIDGGRRLQLQRILARFRRR